MVNPVKALNRATGLSNLFFEKGTAANTEALRAGGQDAEAPTAIATPTTPPPTPAPVFGQDPAPKKSSKKPRQFSPAIIGSQTASVGDSGGGGKTLLGQ